MYVWSSSDVVCVLESQGIHMETVVKVGVRPGITRYSYVVIALPSLWFSGERTQCPG